MSPDNYIPMPLSPGGYNRYNYANSNPLKFTDPSGDFWWIVGAIIGGFSGWQIGKANGAKGWSMFGYIAGGAAIGAATAGIGTYGAAALGTVGATTAAGAVGGAAFGGLSSGWNASSMLKGAAFGAVGGALGGSLGASGIFDNRGYGWRRSG